MNVTSVAFGAFVRAKVCALSNHEGPPGASKILVLLPGVRRLLKSAS
jgi:hypothetical protein